jgi:hypothetical protein
VTGRSPGVSRSLRLQKLDQVLARDPDATDARAERAGLLREQTRFEDAKRDYLELLRRKPDDFAALNDFGMLVLNAGYREAARSLFGEAVRRHPDNANGRVNLANLLFLLDEQAAAHEHFEAALKIDPGHIHAHRGMANLLAARGDMMGARAHRDKGFKGHALTVLPHRGEGTPINVLLLVSAADKFAARRSPIPNVGSGDGLCRSEPRAAAARSRLQQHRRCRSLRRRIGSGLRDRRADDAAGDQSSDARAQDRPRRECRALARLAQCRGAADDEAADDVWLIERLNARDGAGMYRKYRAMFVGGTLYPLHLAVSRDWKVHYFTADMADSPENRAKDEEFLTDMAGAIGPGAMIGLERIRTALKLDYGGIDFAVNPQGDILFFEANATMVVTPPLLDPKWAYRRPAVEAVLAAVRTMLVDRSVADRAA